MHGGLPDMILLRFARKTCYGYFSALGMFIGHYLARVRAARLHTETFLQFFLHQQLLQARKLRHAVL